MGEGQGDDIPASIYLMNPVSPYNTTGGFYFFVSLQADCYAISNPEQPERKTVQLLE
jgi:hypothetical protein